MSKLSNWMRVLISLGLLGLLLWQVGAGNTLARLREMNLPDFFAALGLYLLGVVLRAWRWQGLLAALGLRARLARLTELYFVGTFFNNMLPTGVGGDVVRVYELSKQGETGAAHAASSVIVDRATGLITLMAMALVTLGIGLALYPGLVEPSVALVIVAVSAGVLIAMLAMMEAERLRGLFSRIPLLARALDRPGVRRFAESFRRYRGAALNRALLLSILFNFQLIATNYFLGLGLGVNQTMDTPLLYYLLFIPITSFVLTLPISISGLGAREAAYVALFGSVGVPADQALALSLAFYLVNVLTGLVGGVLYFVSGMRGARAKQSAAESVERV